MGVEQVYNLLKKKKGFHTAVEIAKELELNERSIRESLKIVTRYKDIICEYSQLIRNKIQKHVGIKTKRTWVYAHVNQIKKQGDEYHGRRRKIGNTGRK